MNTNKNKKQFRQGDVWIERVVSVPAAAVPQKRSRRIILAHGEVTGHHHALEAKDPADYWKTGDDDAADQFVQIKVSKEPGAPAVITHQEHAPIALDPGIYRVRRQREYSPQENRSVAD